MVAMMCNENYLESRLNLCDKGEVGLKGPFVSTGPKIVCIYIKKNIQLGGNQLG